MSFASKWYQFEIKKILSPSNSSKYTTNQEELIQDGQVGQTWPAGWPGWDKIFHFVSSWDLRYYFVWKRVIPGFVFWPNSWDLKALIRVFASLKWTLFIWQGVCSYIIWSWKFIPAIGMLALWQEYPNCSLNLVVVFCDRKFLSVADYPFGD